MCYTKLASVNFRTYVKLLNALLVIIISLSYH